VAAKKSKEEYISQIDSHGKMAFVGEEEAIKRAFPSNSASKQELPDGYTETTEYTNLKQILKIIHSFDQVTEV
jgi:hypothetical protein